MQFLGRLLDSVSSVSALFSNPHRVREAPLADYGGAGRAPLKEEGRLVLYRNTQSWDCLLMSPDTPTLALRCSAPWHRHLVIVHHLVAPPLKQTRDDMCLRCRDPRGVTRIMCFKS